MQKNRLRKQNMPGSVNAIYLGNDIICGVRNSIKEQLLISHSPVYVNEMLDKIDLIIEASTEMGIDLCRSGMSESVKHRLLVARHERVEL